MMAGPDPYLPSPATPEPQEGSACAWTAASTVLLVDDEPIVRRVLAAQLVAKGLTVVEAGNGHDALAALSVRRFDLLITDLQMPEMDGHQLLARVQEDYPLLRRIVITGYTTMENALEALKLGAVGFAPKPIDPRVMSELVDLALRELAIWRTQLAALRRLRTGAT
jgi:ATP-dependent Lon protease